MREFSGFGRFATHLAALAIEGEAVTEHLTQKSAEDVQKNAKARIGEYQDYTGPFNAWAPLAESTMEDRAAKGYAPNEPLLREGDLRDSIEIERRHDEAVVGSKSDIALWQELGTDRGIPPRPFLGPALYDSKLDICERAGNTTLAWLMGLGWKRPRQLVRSPE
jgi:phage gpG-like protein